MTRLEQLTKLLVDAPEPADVREVRVEAELTQRECGEIFGYSVNDTGMCRAWQSKEAHGQQSRSLSKIEWNLFLLLLDRHPTLKLTRRSGD